MGKYSKFDKDQRKHFRYQFNEFIDSLCKDAEGRALIPFDLSHGGAGFYSDRKYKLGDTLQIELQGIGNLNVQVKFFGEEKSGAPPGYPYKVGVEFIDFLLTPQTLIEFLEEHLNP